MRIKDWKEKSNLNHTLTVKSIGIDRFKRECQLNLILTCYLKFMQDLAVATNQKKLLEAYFTKFRCRIEAEKVNVF
ncbi:hypothetical protein AX660_11905 [Paraglaciecola hydrolytica]|uniref:Uncharacterized protein n=1 Tax=Paraglaciecola hydrolytica TaxID=1799789 RepID=A0A136A0X9_9ALTE|nr:hypothetical protein AX660_11905 [Paraglaciecola hydrolytica]